MRYLLAAAITLGIAACGGSPTGPSGPSNGSLTAQIDGSSFAATSIAVTFTSGILAIAGSDNAQRTLGFGVAGAAPGTFTVGVTSPANASLVVASGSGAQSWQAAQTNGSGSITIASLTANRVVGTFQFVVVPLAGGATGNKTITQGAFDVTF